MSKLLLSACLAGEPTRYDGTDQKMTHPELLKLMNEGRVIYSCPEVDAGLPVPREPIELVGGEGDDVLYGSAKACDLLGRDYTKSFVKGAKLALEACKRNKIKIAILKQRSPSCGVTEIYDGNFQRKRISGAGVTAALLTRNGIDVYSEDEIDIALEAFYSLKV